MSSPIDGIRAASDAARRPSASRATLYLPLALFERAGDDDESRWAAILDGVRQANALAGAGFDSVLVPGKGVRDLVAMDGGDA